jgi:hypothetical protein
MVEEEFTDDDFDDTEVEQVKPIKTNPTNQTSSKKISAQPPTPRPQITATKDVATPTEKFTPYTIPSRIGVFDNELGKPILEDTDITGVMLGLLTKMANDLEEIKNRL